MKFSFPVTRTTTPKKKQNPQDLVFGTVFSDHMFEMDYNPDKGWHDGKIIPYGPIMLDPSTAVFHYGQETFEGLKAYKASDGRALLFRPEKNAERINISNERLCVPTIDPDLMVEAIKQLVAIDIDWIPEAEDTSLYIRPFIIATDPYLGVRPSQTFKLYIILSPVGPYYKGGLNPTKILVEDKYVRAMAGGTGYAKVGGNYAASLKAQEEAIKKGYSQVLWLDGVEKSYVEEIGTSNAFFKIDGEIITSPLTGTILPGITRDSVLQLLKHWGEKVTEKRFTIQEVYEAQASGKLDEVFATGTAAVISPVGELCWKNQVITINNNQIGAISQRLFGEINAIQRGRTSDQFGWVTEI
ncbi:MAG: branched-chain amino acid aminotransferase [Bacillota bacterium]|nr:branched-chain amino acid aminotransferase [Bacillota bacterium]MDW7730318.1 branched-chain amino acid aminotransferase [Bacillota bacterium]